MFVSPATHHPNVAWVKQQAEAFLEHAKVTGLRAALVMHDRDTKFTASFDEVLNAGNVAVQKSPFRSPNTVAFVERFIQTIQQECLDHFVIFGERHFNDLATEWLEHYHQERPHQAKENEVLALPKGARMKPAKRRNHDKSERAGIECRERLGGLVKHYYRRAA